MAGADDPSVTELTAALYRSFVSELVRDIAIEEHKLAWQRQCRVNAAKSLHAQNGNSLLAPPGSKNGASSSRGSSPAPGHSPHKPSSYETVALECLNCSRMIGVARYASHLSGCMGFGGAGGRSSRGDRRAAAGGATPTGHRPPTSGVASIGPGSRASSYASDEESIKRNVGPNSRKRSGSANGRGRPKKAKTDKLGTLDLTQIGSHPLAKTLSAPNATQSPSIPQYTPIPASTQMVARASLPPPGQPSYPVHLAADRPDSDSSSDESSATVAAAAVRRAAAGQVGQKAPRTVFNRHPLARGIGVVPDSGSDSDSSNNSSP
ncbi:hypothetical protein OIV83_006029 [Microbotryomycetes sp. JL201]|nr:hypothetical protein OIV83_006029 [Microbotryomycetes sp. JL201]